MRSLPLLCLLALGCSVPSQGPFTPGRVPQGWVRDEQGKGVDDARVALTVTASADSPYCAAIRHLLARHPLPPTFSNADGSFALPVPPVYRALASLPGVDPRLVVTAAGFRRWREPLPGGIPAYLGSSVRLLRWRTEDTWTFRAKDAGAGARLELRRWLGAQIDERIEVPLREGRARVPFPLLPTPALLPVGSRSAAVRIEARVLFAGRVSDPVVLRDPRVDVRLPRASRVAARGAASTSKASASLVIHVRDPGGHPLRGVLCLLSNGCYGGGLAWRAFPITRADGTVALSGLPAGKHHAMLLHARRKAMQRSFALREDRATVLVATLAAAAPIEVRTRDGKGRPRGFLPIKVPHNPLRRLPQLLRSDSLGRLLLPFQTPHEQVRLIPWMTGGGRGEVGMPGGQVELVAARVPIVAVRLSPHEPRPHDIWLRDGRAGGLGWSFGARGTALLVAWPGAEWSLVLDDGRGPPAWIDDKEVARRYAKDPRVLVTVRRSPVRRRIPLRLELPPGARPERLSIQATDHWPDRVMRVAVLHPAWVSNGSMLERDRRGRMFFVARDDLSHACVVHHPDLVPLLFSVPAKTARRDSPIRLVLQRGGRLVFKIRLAARPVHDADFSFKIVDAKGGKHVLRHTFGRVQPPAGEVIAIPFASPLAEGRYEVTVTSLGRELVRRHVVVRAGETREIALGKLAAKGRSEQLLLRALRRRK